MSYVQSSILPKTAHAGVMSDPWPGSCVGWSNAPYGTSGPLAHQIAK